MIFFYFIDFYILYFISEKLGEEEGKMYAEKCNLLNWN